MNPISHCTWIEEWGLVIPTSVTRSEIMLLLLLGRGRILECKRSNSVLKKQPMIGITSKEHPVFYMNQMVNLYSRISEA